MNSIFFNKLNRLLYFSIFMFVLGDISRKVALLFNLDFNRFTGVSKTIVLLFYLFFLIIHFKTYHKNLLTRKLLYLTLILLLVFFIGQCTIRLEVSLLQNIFSNVLFLCRYLLWPITLLVFLPLIINKNYNNEHLVLFEKLFFINMVCIVLGLFFEISIFKTYLTHWRFGYVGFFNTSNQASYYFIIFILYYYYKAFFKDSDFIRFILVLFVSLLIGTKKIYFFLGILFIYHFFKFKLYKKWKFYILAQFILIFCFIFYTNLKLFLFNKFKIFVYLYEDRGLLSSLSSTRSESLIKTYNDFVLQDWRFPNFILGGPKFPELMVEFGLIDLYLFFGLFGITAYFILFKTLYKHTGYNKFYLFILISVGITDFFSSGFLSDANQPIMFILISGYFIKMKN